MRKLILFLIIFYSLNLSAKEIIEKGSFDLYLNGVKKGSEHYKIMVDKKKDIFELFSELRFQYPYIPSKRGYVDLQVFPDYIATLSTKEFIKYEYRTKVEDYSKTDIVEAENSAKEIIDQDWRITTVFNQEQQRTDDIMNDRIDLGVNAGECYPAGEVLRFKQTRISTDKKKDEKLPENLIILEPYGFALYELLVERLKGEGPRWEFTLAVPQFMRLKPAVIQLEGAIKSYVVGKEFILKHYNVLIDEKVYTSFWLDKNNKVVMVSVPTEGVMAIRSNYQIVPFEKEEIRISKEVIELKKGNFKEEEININFNGVLINGAITIPEKEGTFKALILVQDMDELDKDGNPKDSNLKFSLLKQLAYYFSENNIITLRFDSQGLAAELEGQKVFDVNERVAIISNFLKRLKENEKVNLEEIYFLGFGFGGYPILKISEKENIKGIIFIGFPMKDITRVWKEQISLIQELEVQQNQYLEIDSLISELKKKEAEFAIFRNRRVFLPVIRDLSTFDFLSYLKKLENRVLFVYPEKDNVILPFHGEILEKETEKRFKVKYLKNTGHFLNEVDEKGSQKGFLNKSSLTDILNFIKGE